MLYCIVKGNMKYLLFFLIFSVSCAPYNPAENETIELPPPSINEDFEQKLIDSLINEENNFRISTGLTYLTNGLKCTLFNTNNGASSIATANLTTVGSFTYKGEFNQPNNPSSLGLNVLPISIRSNYTSWFVLKCEGKLVILENMFNRFDLTSDDGSRLYLNGNILIDNDGNHGSQKKTGIRFLKKGVHDIRIEYMQGPGGNQHLVLEHNSSVLKGNKFYK